MIISILSQKGGVGKSTLARAIAVELTKSNWDIHIADLDSSQQTTAKWSIRRDNAGILPLIETSVHYRHSSAFKLERSYDLLIIDGAPHANISTLEIAEKSNLVFLPTGTSIDDLEPSLELATEFIKKKIPIRNIFFVISKAVTFTEINSAIRTVREWGFNVIKEALIIKTAYSKAQDIGKSISETSYKSLNNKTLLTIQEIANIISERL